MHPIGWRAGLWVLALMALGPLGCEDDVAGDDPTDYRIRDVQPALGDARRDDAAPPSSDRGPGSTGGGLDRAVGGDGGPLDAAGADLGGLDLSVADDMAMARDRSLPDDMLRPLDMAPPIDLAPPPPDLGPNLPPGRELCQQGPGWSLLRISYDAFSTSPRDDLWDVPCDYSIRINDACGVFDRCRGGVGCEVGRTNSGAVELDGSDDLLIWFSTPPERVEAAVFYVLGRSLCAASPTEFDLASPTDGWAVSGGPVGQQFEYQWHFAALPRFAGDDLAIILTAGRGCGRLGVQAFEICVP